MEKSDSNALIPSILRKYWEIITLIVLTAYCLAYELCSTLTVFSVLYALAYLHLLLHTISFEVRGYSNILYNASLLALNAIQIFTHKLSNTQARMPFYCYQSLHGIIFSIMSYKKYQHNNSGKPGSDSNFLWKLFGVYVVTQVITGIVVQQKNF